MRRIKTALASAVLALSGAVHALETPAIIASTASPDCIEYRVVGICYWLLCGLHGCKVRTSIKVRHYVPDAVVSSYVATGHSTWTETAPMGAPIPGIAEDGGDGTTTRINQNEMTVFRNVDVIGHPGMLLFNDIVSALGYSCEGAGAPFIPYFLSTLDSVGWRYNIPETVYPEALIPGMREIGSIFLLNTWGNVYPRGGFTHQADDYKASATTAQRAGDIVTRQGQPHVYQPLLASPRAGYWPAGALVESDASTGKWQELAPQLSLNCRVFPDNRISLPQAQDARYAWALWRPYACCKRRGQIFLGSVDFM